MVWKRQRQWHPMLGCMGKGMPIEGTWWAWAQGSCYVEQKSAPQVTSPAPPPRRSSRARWVRGLVHLADFHGDISGPHWKDMQDLLPVYQAITCFAISNSLTTSFWRDRWLSACQLSDMFPLLLTHVVDESMMVAQVMTDGLELHLPP